MLIAIFAISLITFVLVKSAPGNYLETKNLIEQNMNGSSVTPEMKAQWEKTYDLDKPEWYQYLKFTVNAFRLKFGPSFKYPDEKVEDIIAARFPTSLKLAVLSMTLALLVGIPLGILAGVNKNTIIDRIAVLFSMLGQSIPSYAIAIFIIYFFSIMLHLTPTVGWGKPIHYVCPLLAMAIGPIGTVAKFLRNSIIGTMEKEYVKVAIAKGGSFKEIIGKHVLRNSLIPLVTVIGPMIARQAVGTVFIENLFAIPGLGSYFATAASNRDYPLVMASTLFLAFMVMSSTLIVDIIYGILDPRIRKNSMEG
jgi:ABC-type dipeptide/oligopeptide/nickel transport systems, permease components